MNGTLKRLDTVHENLSTAIRTTDRDLFFKRPGGVAAISMLGFHEERHYKQIREILKKLGA